MNNVLPNTATRVVSGSRTETQTRFETKQTLAERKVNPAALTGHNNAQFSSVIREAQRDSSEIDLLETVAASQTGRLMRLKGNHREFGTIAPDVGILGDNKARTIERVMPAGHEPDKLSKDAHKSSKERRVDETSSVHGQVNRSETKAQRFSRLTTSMKSVSDVGRYVNVGAFSKIAEILDQTLCVRSPGVEKLLNEKQLAMCIQTSS